MPVRESFSQNFYFFFYFYQGHGVAESHLADFLARNLFWLPTQPASTYSLNSNNHIQIRFAVKQHPISFRNRKNENMYREAFILIHSNRMLPWVMEAHGAKGEYLLRTFAVEIGL